MECKIIMVTGGQRCGKSEFAEAMALRLAENPVYLATSVVTDDEEFQERVRLHRQRRGVRWTTVEEQVQVGSVAPDDRVVLVDCVTLWATNVFFSCGEDVSQALTLITAEIDRLRSKSSTFIFVTNEIGLGGVSENAMRRRFTDLQGRVNQLIATLAEEVYLIVSGIPVKIK